MTNKTLTNRIKKLEEMHNRKDIILVVKYEPSKNPDDIDVLEGYEIRMSGDAI
jgi:hypothetical protein